MILEDLNDLIPQLHYKELHVEKKDTSVLVRTAYHEAGHAVMAYILKIKYVSISIVFTSHGQFKGLIEYPKNKCWSYKYKIPRIMIALSGPLAEHRYNLKDIWDYQTYVGSQDDYKDAHGIAEGCIRFRLSFLGEYPESLVNKDETYLLLSWLYVRAKTILYNKKNWRAVEPLAKDLLKNKNLKLTYKQTRKVIKETLENYNE